MNSVAVASASPLHRMVQAFRRWFQTGRGENKYVAPVLYFVARQHRLAYLQVPKAACTSLRAAICLLNHPELSPELVTSDEWVHRNRKMNDILRPGASELGGMFRFTFVRHPYARFLSFYRNKIAEPDSAAVTRRFARQGFTAGMPIDAALAVIEATRVEELDPHLIPQVDLVYRGGTALVEFIGHVERLAEDIKLVESRSGVALNLPHLNHAAGAGIERARQFLSDSARARLQQIYARDFDRFAYEA
jgi:hypothetical protein